MLVSCNTSNSEPAEQLSNSPSAPPLCIALALALLPLGYQLPYSIVPQIITWPLSIREVSADDMRGLGKVRGNEVAVLGRRVCGPYVQSIAVQHHHVTCRTVDLQAVRTWP